MKTRLNVLSSLFLMALIGVTTGAHAGQQSSNLKWQTFPNSDRGAHTVQYSNMPRHCRNTYSLMESSDFETLLYIASYRDLARKFGADVRRGRDHFVRYGCREGRRITFEPLQYIAGYDDLLRKFGMREREALNHYFRFGVRENRHSDRFCGRAYADIYPDLRRAFGYNEFELAQHYIRFGHREGRGSPRFQRPC